MNFNIDPKLSARYQAAMHAIQSGVAMEQENGSTDGTPKHLRVGINSAMIETSALTRLLVRKGIITNIDEFFEVLIEVTEEEVATYEKRLSQRLGADVKLG